MCVQYTSVSQTDRHMNSLSQHNHIEHSASRGKKTLTFHSFRYSLSGLTQAKDKSGFILYLTEGTIFLIMHDFDNIIHVAFAFFGWVLSSFGHCIALLLMLFVLLTAGHYHTLRSHI